MNQESTTNLFINTMRTTLKIMILLLFANAKVVCQDVSSGTIVVDGTYTPIPGDKYTAGGGSTSDDGTYSANPALGASLFDILFDYNLFGSTYSGLYLNINGHVTFNGPYPSFTITPIKDLPNPTVAPFWADIDLVVSSEAEYPQEVGKDGGIIYYKSLDHSLEIVWKNVGYFRNKLDKRNTFSLTITDGQSSLLPAGKNTRFCYESMEWTTGGQSGGTNGFCGQPATVGLSLGNGKDFKELGRFDHDGKDFDINKTGISGENCKKGNGVSWLENKCFYYDLTKTLIAQVGDCNDQNNTYSVSVTLFTAGLPNIGKLDLYIDNVKREELQMPLTAVFEKVYNDYISDGQEHTVKVIEPLYNIELMSTKYKAPNKCTESCSECITSFSPIPGEKYLLSAWVKESYTGILPKNYVNSGVRLTFNNGTVKDDVLWFFRPKGPVVDGWQRIESSFTVPIGANNIQIELVNESTSLETYFDDIRIHPFRSNMKSFVYDPSSQRLVAELDENNYATQYEYDDEGILIRVKKETERGVMTIKESRNNQSKIFK